MDEKSKPCKGNYKVNYFNGCRTTEGHFRRYGLCASCLRDWSFKTEEGNEWYNKQSIKNTKQELKDERRDIAEQKVKIMSNQEFCSKKVQLILNEIARLIDHKQKCIATDNFAEQMHGGHYYSVKSNPTLRLNIHNIHQQSLHSNKFIGGDDKRYANGLKRVYGTEYLDWIYSLHQCPLLHLNRQDLEEIRVKAMAIRLRLKKDAHLINDPNERIALRNAVNEELNIYPKEFSVFLK